MAPVYSLAITDWRTENTDVLLNKPYLIDYFSTNPQRDDISFDLKGLKYFDNEYELDMKVVQTKFINSNLELPPSIHYDSYKLFYQYHTIRQDSYPVSSIRTSRSVLSKILITPFEIMQQKRKWIIKAVTNNKGIIRLYYDKENFNFSSESLTKQDELLKRYLFNKKPFRYYRKVTSVFNEIFSENYEIKIGDNTIIYSTEIPGVISDQEIHDLNQLREAEHVFYELFENGDIASGIINYNPVWWSKAILINAKQCIVGIYDKEYDCIQEIIKFNTNEFDDKTKYENLWSPEAAWNFLNDFLKFVKETVNSVAVEVRDRCIWKFESFPNDKPSVSCETLLCTMNDGKNVLYEPLDSCYLI